MWLELIQAICPGCGFEPPASDSVLAEVEEALGVAPPHDLYMPFDPLFFFAWAGNGDLFFFPIQAGGIQRDDVSLWDHESDSRVWVASNLQQFVERWFSGRLRH